MFTLRVASDGQGVSEGIASPVGPSEMLPMRWYV